MSAGIADISAMIAGVPYARFLGLRLELAGDEMTAVMPYSEVLIGNPMLPAIHGGVLGALMEMTALAQIGVARANDARVPPEAPPASPSPSTSPSNTSAPAAPSTPSPAPRSSAWAGGSPACMWRPGRRREAPRSRRCMGTSCCQGMVDLGVYIAI